MTNINIKTYTPTPPPTQTLTAIERFLWWKRQYFITLALLITTLIIPLYYFRKNNINLGIRINIILYAFIIILQLLIKNKTNRKDTIFLQKQGIRQQLTKKWYHTPLNLLFWTLRIYIIYLMTITWRMTNG